MLNGSYPTEKVYFAIPKMFNCLLKQDLEFIVNQVLKTTFIVYPHFVGFLTLLLDFIDNCDTNYIL